MHSRPHLQQHQPNRPHSKQPQYQTTMAQPFPTPYPTSNDRIAYAITKTQGGMDDRMLYDPLTLFSSDYDAHNGNILSIDQIDDNSSLSLKRSATPPSPSFTNGSFMPRPRRQRARLSPARVAIAAPVTIAITDVLTPPPPMIRTHSSPTSVISSVFNPPAPP